MNKFYFNILIALIATMSPIQTSAQLFKKILKGAGEVLSNTVSTTQSKYGEVLGVTIEWDECVRWGDNVNVKFTMCNHNSGDITMNFFNTWPSGEDRSFAIASNGERYGITFLYLGGNVNDNCSVTLPSGVKVKGIARINKAGGNVNKFKYVSIGGYNPGNKTPQFCYTSRSMDVKEVANTNRDNLKCTLPSITVNEQSINRYESAVAIDFTLLQSTGKDMSLSFGPIRVFDTEGNSYSVELLPDEHANMISDVPLKRTLAIKGIPKGTNLSIIRITVADKYLIEWRNVTMP